MNLVDPDNLLQRIRLMLSPAAATQLAETLPWGACIGCGGHLIHRGVIEGMIVRECIRCHKPYLQAGNIIAIDKQDDGAQAQQTIPPPPSPAAKTGKKPAATSEKS